jgi:hypothetical protein
METGQEADRHFCGPAVAPYLKSRGRIIVGIYRRLFRLDVGQAASVALNAVVGGFCLPGYTDTVFVNYFPERFVVCLFVVHIPAKNLDRFVKKITAEMGLVVGGIFVAFCLLVKIID